MLIKTWFEIDVLTYYKNGRQPYGQTEDDDERVQSIRREIPKNDFEVVYNYCAKKFSLWTLDQDQYQSL